MRNINHTGTNDITADDIRADYQPVANEMYTQFKKLQAEYWALHAKIGEAEFNHWTDQNAAILKLSELGIALKKFGDAYSAMNIVRCITD